MNKEMKFEMNGNRGFVATSSNVLTFEVQGIAEREEIIQSEYINLYSKYSADNISLRLEDYTVPMWGDRHNLYPQEVYSMTSENKLLPELIEKQVRFLFGKGPRIYREIITGDGDNKHRVRIPHYDSKINAWLESWEDKGHESYWEYLMNLIRDYYFVKTCVTKYHFNKGRRFDDPGSIDALSYVGSDEARLAAKGDFLNKRLKNKDCKYVIVGDWMNISRYVYDVFPRFDTSAPYKYPVAIAFNAEKTFTRWTYAFNEWFRGLYEWIKASNLTPRYINSYLKNALNAHVHVIIPGTWYNAQKTILQNICEQNLASDDETPLQAEYNGVKLLDSSGKPYRFYDTMMQDLINYELRKITSLMSGEGRNQGKLYATTKWGEDGWKFEDMPGKFKDYIDSLITFDKRADTVILAGKGISSSISNVENDGVISKSGSDVYYNYLLYIMQLTLDEYFITKEINRAIHLNFPGTKEQGVKLGFWIDIPAKQQETTASQRLTNTATADPTK